MWVKITLIINQPGKPGQLSVPSREVDGMINLNNIYLVTKHPEMLGVIIAESYLDNGNGLSWIIKSTLEDFYKLVNPPGLNPIRLQ